MRAKKEISFVFIWKVLAVLVLLTVGVTIFILSDNEGEVEDGNVVQKVEQEVSEEAEQTVLLHTGTNEENEDEGKEVKTTDSKLADWSSYESKGFNFIIQYPEEYYYVKEKANGSIEVVNIFEESAYDTAYKEAKDDCEKKGTTNCSVYFSRTNTMSIEIKSDGKTLTEYADIYGATNQSCVVGGIKGLCTVALGYRDPIPYFLFEQNGSVVVFSNVGTLQKLTSPLPTVDPRSGELEKEKETIVSTFTFLQ